MIDWGAFVLHWGGLLLQLVFATVCGGVIGYQRQMHDRPAGFRTHVLVCVGSAVYMMISVAVAGDRFDPGRIAAQVASGMGFLGAGTIIKQGNIVRGLTTAASLWAVAALGLAIGYGGPALGIAILGTLVVLTALGGLMRLEQRMERGINFSVTLGADDVRQQVEWVQQVLTHLGVEITSITLTDTELTLSGHHLNREDIDTAVQQFTARTAVKHVRWEFQ